MRAIPEDLATLIADLETFLSDGLKGENLSKKAKEKREVFIKRIKEVKSGYPQDFKEKYAEESGGDEEVDSYNGDEDVGEEAQQAPAVPAQDLVSVFKAGPLEKRRKDHSFFGTEWQKRWCALSQHTFYYYGSEKDKQQKGEFSIDGYSVRMNNTLRKDSKKDLCFEIYAADKRGYQFCASSQKEADEWVEQIDFVLKDKPGTIPVDDDDDQDYYDDIGQLNPAASEPIDDDIYEELPDEAPAPKPPLMPAAPKPKVEPPSKAIITPPVAVNKSTDYPNYYQGLWDCTGEQPDELSFKRGDAIYILSREYQTFGWWVGEMKGCIGIVPRDYLMELYVL